MSGLWQCSGQWGEWWISRMIAGVTLTIDSSIGRRAMLKCVCDKSRSRRNGVTAQRTRFRDVDDVGRESKPRLQERASSEHQNALLTASEMKPFIYLSLSLFVLLWRIDLKKPWVAHLTSCWWLRNHDYKFIHAICKICVVARTEEGPFTLHLNVFSRATGWNHSVQRR